MLRRSSLSVILCSIILLVAISSSASFAALGDRTLARGSRGSEVTELQRRLASLGYVVAVDGIYGSQTQARVRLFQKDQRLAIDGIAGPKTIARLKLMTGASSNAGGKNVGYKSSDIDLLVRVVSAEAKGEPYRGQVAVAAVVLNRLKSSSFPNSIPDIIYEPRAFEPVANGTLWKEPVASARQAVNEALAGTDPSYGALFFFNPAKTSNAFVWSRPQTTQIGKHIFAR